MVLKIPYDLTPGFSTKVKPSVPVVVDYSKDITRGLYSVNLCKNDPATIGSGATIDTLGGAQGYFVTGTPGVNPTGMRQISNQTNYSVFIVWAQNNFGTFQSQGFCMYSERPNATQIFKCVVIDADQFTLVTRNDAGGGLINIPTGPAVDTGRLLHTGCFVKRGDADRDLYCDGNYVNITTSSGGTYSTAATPTIGYDENDGSVPANVQNIFAVYTWNRALTDSEVKSLERDPYLIFKPATPLYSIKAGVGGAFTLSADSGTYTYTGTNAGIEAGLKLSANSGSYTYSGTAADLNYGFVLTADSGSYTYSGTTAALNAGFVVSSDSGSYSYSGTTADLSRDVPIAADSGTYTYSGTEVALTFAGAGNFFLTALSGSYSYTGTNANLAAGLIMAADSGSYSYSGTAAGLNRGYTLVGSSGAYTYSGTSITISKTFVLTSDSGSYSYSGTNVVFRFSGQVWTVQTNDTTTWIVQ